MTRIINTAIDYCLDFSDTDKLSVSKIIVAPLIISLLVFMSGCQSSNKESKAEPVSSDLVALQNAKAKWGSNTEQYYTVQSQRICECLPELSALMDVSVLDNSVLTAIDAASGEIISKDVQKEVVTVENMFSLIESAINDNTSIEVTYNEEYGYPETTKIDVEQLAVDGGIHITLSKLALHDAKLALDDVTWTLVSFDSITGPQTVIKNSNITLSIDIENRQLGGIGGCNAYGADFVLDDESHQMTISNVISTQMWCEQPEDVMQQEQNYFATLEKVRFFTLDEEGLNMVVGGDAGLHFTSAHNSPEEVEIDSSSNDLTLLESARKKWQSHSGQYYTVQSKKNCFCLDEMTAQMKVSILNDSVLSAVNIASGEVISKAIQAEISTVDTLFSLIERAIADDISIEVSYNEEFGYPEITKIDIEQLAADGGLHITLSNLEILLPTMALDDVTWTLESFDNIAGPQTIIKDTKITLSVDMESMILTGVGGCNNYSADFVLDDESHDITISNVISTEMWCAEPEKTMQQEKNYFTTLGQIRFFTFDEAKLSMVVGADAGLNFIVVN